MNANARTVLHRLVDLCDAQAQKDRDRDVQLNRGKLTACLPELETANQDDAELLHVQLQAYAAQGWISLQHSRGRDPLHARLIGVRLAPGMEAALRVELDRPIPGNGPRERQWHAAIEAHLRDLPLETRAGLLRVPLDLPEREPSQLAARLAQAGLFLRNGLSLREASARAFWGHSKVLDGRAALVAALCDQPTALPVALQVHVPAAWKTVLWIENETSFVRACLHMEVTRSPIAIAFCSGYKGTARRLRSRSGTRLFASPSSDADGLIRFDDWLVSDFPEEDADTAFFGDLDFSGMSILRELRQSFPRAHAWLPGYQGLLAQLDAQEGHTAQEGGKTGQLDPGITGCTYADQELLPAIRRSGHTVDQEAFDWSDLKA